MRKFSSLALIFILIIGAAIIGANAQSAEQAPKARLRLTNRLRLARLMN